MAHQTFKEFLRRTRERIPSATEARVRAIRRELQTNKHLTEGERLILEMQLINHGLLIRQ